MEIRRILQAVAKAYRDFASAFSEEKNTDELFSTFEESLKNSLGEYEIVYDYIWGKDTLGIDGVTKNYLPKKGDTLIMDISLCRMKLVMWLLYLMVKSIIIRTLEKSLWLKAISLIITPIQSA